MNGSFVVAACVAIVVAGCGVQPPLPLPPGSAITWHGRQYNVSGNILPDSKVRCDLGKIDSGLANDNFPACRILEKGALAPNKVIAIHVSPGTNRIAFYIGQ